MTREPAQLAQASTVIFIRRFDWQIWDCGNYEINKTLIKPEKRLDSSVRSQQNRRSTSPRSTNV